MLTSWGIQHFMLFVMGTIGIVLLPGPNSLFVLSLVLQKRSTHIKHNPWQKIKVPLLASLGIMVGDTILMLLANLGVASILHANPQTFHILSMLSGIYIAYIGFGMVRKAYAMHQMKQHMADPLTEPGVSRAPPTMTTPKKAFIKALGISLVNPKAILFFTTFFVQFIQPDYRPIWHPLFILMLTLQCISFAYLLSLMFVGHQLLHRFQTQNKRQEIALALMGTLFMCFGGYFLTS